MTATSSPGVDTGIIPSLTTSFVAYTNEVQVSTSFARITNESWKQDGIHSHLMRMNLTVRFAQGQSGVEHEPTRTAVHAAQDLNSPEPPGGPSPEFLEETIRVWQKYSDRPLTHDDARQIIENMTGFFKHLREIDRAVGAQRRDL